MTAERLFQRRRGDVGILHDAVMVDQPHRRQFSHAVVLRDRLRQQGFEAFSEQAQADGDTTMWRVRVGPVPTRERAESLKAELESQRGEPALVTTYP